MAAEQESGEERTTGGRRGAGGGRTAAASHTRDGSGEGPGGVYTQPGSLVSRGLSLQTTRRLIKHRLELLEEVGFLVSLLSLRISASLSRSLLPFISEKFLRLHPCSILLHHPGDPTCYGLNCVPPKDTWKS